MGSTYSAPTTPLIPVIAKDGWDRDKEDPARGVRGFACAGAAEPGANPRITPGKGEMQQLFPISSVSPIPHCWRQQMLPRPLGTA